MIYVKIRSANTLNEMRVVDNEMESDGWSFNGNISAVKIAGVYYRYYEKDV